MRWLPMLLLLAGCQYEWESAVRDLTDVERAHVERTRAAWWSDGWAYGGEECGEDMERLQVAPIPVADVPGACLSETAGACLREGLRSAVLFGSRELAAIVPDDLTEPQMAAVLVHETLHLLHGCSDLYQTVPGVVYDADPYHRTPGMWLHIDGPDSTEGRAQP